MKKEVILSKVGDRPVWNIFWWPNDLLPENMLGINVYTIRGDGSL